MSIPKSFLLALLSGILLSASWPPLGFAPLLLFAWVPLLVAEEYFFVSFNSGRKFKFFLLSYCCFLVWNALTTWWIWNSTNEGAIMAILANSLLMALVFFFFHMVKRRSGRWIGYFAFAAFWLAFEYLHHRWDLTWPWLTLGNAFAGTPWLIQWYEFTGTAGGSLWVILSNIVLAELVLRFFPAGMQKGATGKGKLITTAALIILLPALGSFLLSVADNISEKRNEHHVVLIQPNLDPYAVKFDMDTEDQMKIFLSLAKSKMKPETKVVVLPETAISDGIYEDRYEDSWAVTELTNFCRLYPGIQVITGATSWKQFKTWEEPTPTARKFGNSWYDAYNSALHIDSTGVRASYHKSKLVPGVEKMPYPALFGWLGKYAIDLGGTSGTLGVQEERGVFPIRGTGIVVGPVICYESIFGEYVGDYLRKGANAIFILTNDGWWGDTPGYKQHLIYGALRAIEYRVPVIRCTNTGVSCFINTSGEIKQRADWWTRQALDGYIPEVNSETFYFRHGDYIGRAAIVIAVLLLVVPIFIRRA